MEKWVILQSRFKEINWILTQKNYCSQKYCLNFIFHIKTFCNYYQRLQVSFETLLTQKIIISLIVRLLENNCTRAYYLKFLQIKYNKSSFKRNFCTTSLPYLFISWKFLKKSSTGVYLTCKQSSCDTDVCNLQNRRIYNSHA